MGRSGEAGQLTTINHRIGRITAPVVIAATLVLSSCGTGESFDREAAAESFAVANPEATAAQTDCVVDRLVDRYGLEQLEQELEADPLNPGFEEDQFRDMFACGIEGDVRSQIVEQLEANGVTGEDAPCVADQLIVEMEDQDFDVLLSGQITDEFLAKFVDAMEACGAINS